MTHRALVTASKRVLGQSRFFWGALVVPGLMVKRRVNAVGNWVRCRSLEARNPGLQVESGVLCRGASRISIRGRTLLERGVRVDVAPTGRLIFEGDNYALRGSQISVGPGQTVLIGQRTTIDRDVTIGGNVQIGPDCLIAPNAFVSSGRHLFREEADLTIREQDKKFGHLQGDRPVVVDRNCWLGVGSVILAGVVLGPNTVVGAGAVVSKSFPVGDLVLVGVPARASVLTKPPQPSP